MCRKKLVLILLAAVLAILSQTAFAAIEDEQDRSHINVEKVFTGITKEQIPASLQLIIQHENTTYQLLPYPDSENIILQEATEADGKTTYRWRLQNLAAGEYTVLETGHELPGYQVTTAGIGTQYIEAAKLTFTNISQISQQVMKKGFPMTEESIFIGRLNGGVGTAIVTLSTLNASERAAFEQWLPTQGNLSSPYYFFSIEEQLTEENPSFTVNGKTINYDFSDGLISFAATNMWSNAYQSVLTYDDTEYSHADFRITNTYVPYRLLVSKVVNGNLGSENQLFDYTITLPAMAGQTIECSRSGEAWTLSLNAEGQASFALSHGQTLALNAVYGDYTISEAPFGQYTTMVQVNSSETSAAASVSGSLVPGDNQVTFTNTLELPLPTGVHDSVGITLAGLLLVAAIIFILRMGRRYAQ